jgi:DNA-binding MarR family transcriptional regulator
VADEGLNELEDRVSTLLQDHKGGLTVGEISEHLGVDQGYIYTVLRTLLEDGWLTRVQGVWKLAGETTR